MRSIITMSLPKEVQQAIDRVARLEHIPRSQVMQLALNEYLMAYDLRRIRQKLVPKAQKQGIFTDEDVFDIVS